HHRAMAARPSEQAPFSLQNFLQNLQDTISKGCRRRHLGDEAMIGESHPSATMIRGLSRALPVKKWFVYHATERREEHQSTEKSMP
ncbi:hypothetical protein, partial [Mesorhizobium sp. M0977]|uniref:hypothetical protein n=1 Tax=Mesorhizobium sp. M0977 TaxID=2957039 RepID=UPI00333AF797